MESVFAYVNNIDILGQTEEDLLHADFICRQFEALSGALVNRNRKSAILGLGTWAGRQDWPLKWLASPTTLRVFGVDFAASIKDTTAASWQAATIRFQVAIAPWQQRQVPTLRAHRNILETFLFSKLYYLAQALPLPAVAARAITASAGAFLWGEAGFGAERVAWETLHNPFISGGHLPSRAEVLLVKQSCWMAGQQDQSATHLAYWHGHCLRIWV